MKIILDMIERGESKKNAYTAAGVSETSFHEWQQTKPEFAAAIKEAEHRFQLWEMNDILASARKGLRTLIEGVEYDEIKTEYEQDPDNPSLPRIKKQFMTKKRILPNVTAVIFTLTNRDPEHWQNRISGDLTQRVEVEQKPNISLANVPDDLLKQLIESISVE